MSMTPETRLSIEVEVLAELPPIGRVSSSTGGSVTAAGRTGSRYSTGVGETRIGWFPADEVRRRLGREGL